ncbi:MAG: hypothetical protein CMP39_04185 [Rickettsiales bacterium]|nr:hypothetical protein [Rickettsiales bacterium]|tara:strand:- start:493 stop:690 length:198 start_codon:yes stop_codon:yes gene_type:complete
MAKENSLFVKVSQLEEATEKIRDVASKQQELNKELKIFFDKLIERIDGLENRIQELEGVENVQLN